MDSCTVVGRYESYTRDILSQYAEGRIGFMECIHALDGALVAAIPDLPIRHLPRLRSVMRENTKRFLETNNKGLLQ